MGLYETTNWGLYEGGDDESYITEDGKCSGCGEQLDFDDLTALNFYDPPNPAPMAGFGGNGVEESGVQPGTADGPAVHWASGTITCPNCLDQLPFETSS